MHVCHLALGLLTAATPVGGKQINVYMRYEEKFDFAISSLVESLAKVFFKVNKAINYFFFFAT